MVSEAERGRRLLLDLLVLCQGIPQRWKIEPLLSTWAQEIEMIKKDIPQLLPELMI